MSSGAGLTGNDLFPGFSDDEYARRFRAVRDAMVKDNLEAILVSGARGSSEVHYLANYLAQSPCWLLLPRDGDPTVFIHFFNHQPCAQAQSDPRISRVSLILMKQFVLNAKKWRNNHDFPHRQTI